MGHDALNSRHTRQAKFWKNDKVRMKRVGNSESRIYCPQEAIHTIRSKVEWFLYRRLQFEERLNDEHSHTGRRERYVYLLFNNIHTRSSRTLTLRTKPPLSTVSHWRQKSSSYSYPPRRLSPVP